MDLAFCHHDCDLTYFLKGYFNIFFYLFTILKDYYLDEEFSLVFFDGNVKVYLHARSFVGFDMYWKSFEFVL